VGHARTGNVLQLALLATLLACGGGTGGEAAPIGDPPPGGEPVELAGIVAAHNSVRAGVGVGPLAWSDALAATAAAWAAQCVDVASPIGLLDHNQGRSAGHPWYVGENIFASTGTASGTTAVARWSAEVSDYDYVTNTCAAGKVCGHYTQVVWAATTQVGCARRDCPALTYHSTIVCDYGPGGNVGGQRPY
jgi:pathogenesis-related protein 1